MSQDDPELAESQKIDQHRQLNCLMSELVVFSPKVKLMAQANGNLKLIKMTEELDHLIVELATGWSEFRPQLIEQ